MRIAVWKTGHEIADTIADAAYDGLKRSGIDTSLESTYPLNDIETYDCHVGYGILRGTPEVFKQAKAKGKFWLNLDKGYFKPSHFSGYYRVSLNGTQQTTGLDNLQPDYERWDKLGLPIEKLAIRAVDAPVLICPPTNHVHNFFQLNDRWQGNDEAGYTNAIVRFKGNDRPLQEDLNACRKVYTFNSSVGWEALRQGMPVISDPIHSIVGAYGKLMDKPLNVDYEARCRLFSIMASLQLTLDEMRQGLLWPLITRLLEANHISYT